MHFPHIVYFCPDYLNALWVYQNGIHMLVPKNETKRAHQGIPTEEWIPSALVEKWLGKGEEDCCAAPVLLLTLTGSWNSILCCTAAPRGFQSPWMYLLYSYSPRFLNVQSYLGKKQRLRLGDGEESWPSLPPTYHALPWGWGGGWHTRHEWISLTNDELITRPLQGV